MESQPQNPEFRHNPENFHPCNQVISYWLISGTKVLMYKSKGSKIKHHEIFIFICS